ncbi:MAG: diphthamide synthesis protein [Candidatus Nanoarchaeia archaeon]|nr:diphthamide synthesis protein [Candidatus Nanoarchaeia archaeon]
MKKLFIESKSNEDISEVLKKVKISGRIGLASSIQFLNKLPEAKKYLKKSVIAGQVLGCNASLCKKIKNKVDCFLYIGSGEFHPIRIAVETNKPIYIANPITNEFSKLDASVVETNIRMKRAKLSRFYSAEKIGVIFSLKPGQNKLNELHKILNRIKKESYIFIADNINPGEFENFQDIELWINTACPRIEDKKIINLEDLTI